jgi:hypothetical protein
MSTMKGRPNDRLKDFADGCFVDGRTVGCGRIFRFRLQKQQGLLCDHESHFDLLFSSNYWWTCVFCVVLLLTKGWRSDAVERTPDSASHSEADVRQQVFAAAAKL